MVSVRLSTALPGPPLSEQSINICGLAMLIEGQNEYRMLKEKGSRSRFTGH